MCVHEINLVEAESFHPANEDFRATLKALQSLARDSHEDKKIG
jgi:hypothetical protein